MVIYLILPYLILSYPIFCYLTFILSYRTLSLISFLLISSHPISSHLISHFFSSHFISSHLTHEPTNLRTYEPMNSTVIGKRYIYVFQVEEQAEFENAVILIKLGSTDERRLERLRTKFVKGVALTLTPTLALTLAPSL
jgi:hypothetical protein